MPDQRTYCCGRFANTPEEKLSTELFNLSAQWYAEHPLAVGCGSRQVKAHQRQCQDATRAAYFADREAIEQRCGFFEPITVISILLTIIRLFYDWSHRPR